MDPLERAELRPILLSIVPELPERQRLVAQLYIEHSDAFAARDIYQQLAKKLSPLTGRREDPQTVKSLWYAARPVLAAGLRSRGYQYPEESGS